MAELDRHVAGMRRHGSAAPDELEPAVLAGLDAAQRVDAGQAGQLFPERRRRLLRRAELRVPVKQAVTIRLDADVLEWFKGQGTGYQTRINQLLRQYMQAQQGRRG